MCGVLGFKGYVREGQWGQTYRLLESLFIHSQHRGQDATGFVALTSPFKDRSNQQQVIDKSPEPAQMFLSSSDAWHSLRHHRCSTVVGHVRYATDGPPDDNRNNHPHSSRDGRLHIVHNGVIGNYRELAARNRAKLQSQCDSEILLRLCESQSHVAVGLDLALRCVVGSMVAVAYDTDDDLLWMARNEGRVLWLMKLQNDRRIFFASERSILAQAFEEVMGLSLDCHAEFLIPLAADHVHALSTNGSIIALASSVGVAP